MTTALVILGVTSLPTYAAAPTLKLAINADEDSYLSGVEQRYVVEFSCASTTEDCLNSVVTITLPHTITPSGSSNPDSAPDGVNATATAGNKVVTPEIKRPTATTDGLVTYNLGTVAAGTSFQTVLTFTAPRGVTPGSSTVTPVATFSSGDTTVTAQDTVTIYSEPTPLLSKTGPVATPKNVDVTYQITPKYDTTIDGLNGKTNMTNVVVTDPLPQCATYVSSTASGNTITNTAATVPSSYDAATHTVTWNIGDVNPAFMNVVLSVTVHYDDTCTDDTVTNTAKLTGNEMHNETKMLTANASFTHHFDNEVRYGGGFNKRAMSQFERGKQGNWLYSYDNKSNVPVVMEYTDYMTCGLVSPTDGSKDCDKPLMRVKTIDTQMTTPIEITYWTNKGNTGTQTVSRGKAFDFSSFAADEYLTVFHYKQTIPAGESSILNVAGPIGAGTPTTEDGVTYVDVDKNAAAWKAGKSDQWVRVQNCVTDFSMKSLDGTHDIAIPADDFCDVLTLGTALPKYYNAKSTIKGSLASPGSEVTFSVTANNTSTVVDSQPVISDLLPCGMTFVEGSVTGGPAGKEKTVTVRDVTDATGCTRQLVQVTWPGYQTKGGTTIQLRGKVGPSMSAGTHKNEAYISAAEPEYALTSKKATICFYGSTDDTYDVNGDGNTADQVCPVSSTFTVSEQAGASRGSEWEPIMTGPIQIGTGSGIDPSQVTIEYSTSTNPCRGEVINQGDAMTAAPAGCDNNWTATPASWSDVKSYRVYINGQATPIKAGASIPLIVPIKAPDNASGIAYESVAIAATQASNNRAILPTEPIKVALVVALDVALNKTVVSDVDNLAPGDSVTFRIDAGNSGQGKAPDVKVAEAFPVGTTFVSAESHLCTSGYTSGVPGECNTGNAAGTFDGTTWKLGDMLAGQYASLYVTVTLDEGTDGKTLENTASFVNPPEYDQNPDNNIAKASISVKHRLSGKVYYDANDSSSYTNGEEGFKDITVELLGPDGAVIATTTTDTDGNYSFTRLPAGDYTVKVTKAGAIANLDQTEDPDSTKDNTSGTVTLNADNPVQENINFGYVKKHAISGNVYLDQNRDKTKDGGDIPQSGITVNLVDASGAVVATTTTDADGNYSFTGLGDGTYKVRVRKEGPIAGLEQTGDPDATKDNASEPITLNNDNPSKTDVNFGYVNNNSLSGTVYRDDSRNGDQDGTEPGYSGVIVQLLDKDGQVITTTTTDANGRYSFDKLPDGTYSVTVVKDGELADTEQTEDPDATKDNASEPVTLGEDNPSKDHIDFGYVPDYSIHGLVYRDGDRSESHGTDEKGYANQTVELRDKDGKVVATTTTDADGAYSFEKLPADDYTVTVVKDGALTDLDQTEDPDSTKDSASGVISLGNDHRTRTDVNFGYIANNSINGAIYRDGDRDGRKGDTEGRYSGVTVQLLDKDGTVIATTTTDKDGTYSFEHLPDGTYSIKVVKDGVLAYADQTGDPDTTLDNASKSITLDENNPTKSDVYFGYVPNNTITGTVYRDDNRDKMIDGDEPGLERVSVQLLDEDGNVVQTLDTAADGTYAFQHLKDGKYTVKVVRSSAIKDYDQTEDPDATIDDTSAVYTMGPENSLQENVNFGYVPDYSIAGRVYRDADKSGSYTDGEETFEGVTVDLIDASGTVVATATTTADGTYSFEKLPAGTYRVKVHADGALAGLDQTEDPDGIADSMSGEITIGFDNPMVTGVNFGYVAPDAPATKPSTSLAQRLARTGFDGLVGTAGLGAAAAGGLLLWMRRRRQG